jgi:hypothetical protein
MSTLSVPVLLFPLQTGKTGFDTEVIACLTPRLEPSTKDWPKFVLLALAGIEIQPETGIGIPIASTASVGVNLLKECI